MSADSSALESRAVIMKASVWAAAVLYSSAAGLWDHIQQQRREREKNMAAAECAANDLRK